MRKRILVEELRLSDRIININELLHLGLLREQTASISTDFRYPALAAFRVDRYAVQVKFPQGQWQRISLQWTACPHLCQGPRLGRSYPWRPWFICPFCRRRAGKLYLGRDFAACRTCCQLHYASQSQTTRARNILKIARIRLKLGGKPRPFNLIPKRPPGMAEKVYTRLKAQLELLEYDLRSCRRRRYWQSRKPQYELMAR
jgi:hypothetical protein